MSAKDSPPTIATPTPNTRGAAAAAEAGSRSRPAGEGSTMEPTVFAGASSAALKKVHLQRLMAVIVLLCWCTCLSWGLVILFWAVTPYTPARGSGIIGDFLSVLVSLRSCCALSPYAASFIAREKNRMQFDLRSAK